jgi:hypothetical protein
MSAGLRSSARCAASAAFWYSLRARSSEAYSAQVAAVSSRRTSTSARRTSAAVTVRGRKVMRERAPVPTYSEKK